MSHFNFKSLAFYGGAIAVVVVLFSTVTSYGESHIKAPTAVDGPYRLSFGHLPDCLKSNPLVLNIQQSGSYLSASLLPTNTNNNKGATAAKAKPTLTGRLSSQQLSLSGTAPLLSVCNNAVSQAEASGSPKDNRPSLVKILGQVEGKNLQGKMNLSSIPGDIGFTAQREAPAPSENSTSH